MLKLKLDRPLAMIDIEATGLNARADRIVEISIIKVMPDGSQEVYTTRVNPEMHIPAEVTKIHGISDADVAECSPFDDLAPHILEFLHGCDLSGYSVVHFDIPLLIEEFMRAKKVFDIGERRVIDVQRIFHKKEPRDLTAALAFFCGEKLEKAHSAEADAIATLKVLEGQFEKYPDLPTDVDALAEYCDPRDPDWVDRTGRLKWIDNRIAINFGKKKGAYLDQLAKDDAGYLRWILKSDFPRDAQAIVRDALDGKFYDKPNRNNSTAGKESAKQ